MIGLMDCNNFFVSCERLFRPDLQGKPVLVLSSNDGCVVARSQEVKNLGISMGIPYFEVKDLCQKEEITVFSSNFTLYRDISARVMSALRSEFSDCEIYSVDEAFFSIDATVTEEEIAVIRARIIQKTGIPVSIGVATTKTLAKVANGIAKKGNVRRPTSNMEGVFVLREGERLEVLQDIPCGNVWGMGRQTTAFLSKFKIYTVGDFLRQDIAFIKNSLGIVGERLYLELSGVSVYGMGEHAGESAQSYTSTRSFATPIDDQFVLRSALGHHVAVVAEKLRHDGNVASQLTIMIHGGRFGAFSGCGGTVSVMLQGGTDNTMVLTKEALRLLDTLYESHVMYKKAGVILNKISPGEFTTTSIFEDTHATEKRNDLSAVTDHLNHKFGTGTIRSAVTLSSEKWRERRTLVSKEYTTKWTEIPVVKAN